MPAPAGRQPVQAYEMPRPVFREQKQAVGPVENGFAIEVPPSGRKSVLVGVANLERVCYGSFLHFVDNQVLPYVTVVAQIGDEQPRWALVG